MKLHVTTHACELTQADHAAIARQVEHLGQLLKHVDPDLVNLTLEIEHHARRDEYMGSARLVVFNRALPAKRNSAPTVAALVKRVGEDLEDQVRRFKAHLTRNFGHERKRAALSKELIAAEQQRLDSDRELIALAMSGDRAAFDQLIQADLPGIRRVIEQAVIDSGEHPNEDSIEQTLGDVLILAHREFHRKPARWTLFGWLTSLARRQVAQGGGSPPVSVAVERVAP